MKSIPLTRARHVTNFAVALDKLGIPAERYLSRYHLPVELMENTDGDDIVSAINMLDFAENSALGTGVLDLGLRAGAEPIEGYGEFGTRVTQAPNLYCAIRNFCSAVRSECSEADYYMTTEGTTAWFSHGPVMSTPVQQQQHELYALMIMVQVIRLALGSDWHPTKIRLQTNIETNLSDNDFLRNTNIEFGAPITAVGFPARSLTAPLNGARNNQFDDRESYPEASSKMFPSDPMIGLQDAIANCIRQSGKPSIEQSAEAAGVSKRTLQRFLNSRATSYSSLVDQARLNLAIPLLDDGSISITEIAYELGYSNVAHFSRAFRRITGMSPRSYRHILKQQ